MSQIFLKFSLQCRFLVTQALNDPDMQRLDAFKKVKLTPVTYVPFSRYARVTFPNYWFCQISETPYQVSTATLHPGRLTHYTHRCVIMDPTHVQDIWIWISLSKATNLPISVSRRQSPFFFLHYHNINGTYLTVSHFDLHFNSCFGILLWHRKDICLQDHLW